MEKILKLKKRQIDHIAYAWASGLLYTTDGTAFMDVDVELCEDDQSAIVEKVRSIAVSLIRRAGDIEAISLPRIIDEVLKAKPTHHE